MTENEQKIKLIDIQLLATLGFIFALIISFSLAYDKRQNLANEKRLFNDKEAQQLALLQSILVFIIAMTFLYVTYNQYKISKEHHEKDEKDLLLDTETAVLSVISALVGLYVIIKNVNNQNLNIAEIENI